MLLLCISSISLLARVKPDTTFAIENKVEFSSDQLAYYKGLPEYSYSKSIKYETNIFKRIWNAFTEKLMQALGLSSRSGLNSLLYWLIIILSITGILYHLIKSQGSGMWHRKSSVQEGDETIAIHAHQPLSFYDQDIKDAEASGAYRDAVRFSFIKCILKLYRENIIDWKPEMTNYEILRMIKDPGISRKMKHLIDIYEHVWYGEYEVRDKGEYLKYKQEFNELFNGVGVQV
jgi:hypothetical protein